MRVCSFTIVPPVTPDLSPVLAIAVSFVPTAQFRVHRFRRAKLAAPETVPLPNFDLTWFTSPAKHPPRPAGANEHEWLCVLTEGNQERQRRWRMTRCAQEQRCGEVEHKSSFHFRGLLAIATLTAIWGESTGRIPSTTFALSVSSSRYDHP